MSNRLQCEEPCCNKKPTYKTILPWQVFVAIVLVLIVFLYAKPANADGNNFSSGDVAYVKQDTACEHPAILRALFQRGLGSVIGTFKRGILTYGGREWESCWVEVDGFVLSLDEEGAPLQPIPASQFTNEKPKLPGQTGV